MADVRPFAFLIMAVIALGAIVMYQFGFNALANTDAGVNLSGSPSYQQQYNITRNTSIAGVQTVSYVPYLIGIVALASMLLIFARVKMG